MKSLKAHIPAGLRRTLAAVAITAVAVSGWQLTVSTPSGIGVIGLPGATAEPTGPPGPTGGPGGMNGGQFQPPGLPPQLPDYNAGSNLPPLNQEGGVSIYNTGAQGAPQQAAGQQGAQQGNQGQQPAHGTQIPDYQTATPYTQGPGQANPDYQGPQQGNERQSGQRDATQQPDGQESPERRSGESDSIRELNEQMQKRCELAAQSMDVAEPFWFGNASSGSLIGGRVIPGRDPGWGDWCGPFCDVIELPKIPGQDTFEKLRELWKLRPKDGSYPLPTGYDDLGPTEQSVCSGNPIDCYRAREAPVEANIISRTKFGYPDSYQGPNTVDTPMDAARHCMWMGLTTEAANIDFAQQIGDAHEKDGGDGNPVSSAMDKHNNGVGRAIGLRHEGDKAGIVEECAALAKSAPIVPMPNQTDLSEYAGRLIAIKPMS